MLTKCLSLCVFVCVFQCFHSIQVSPWTSLHNDPTHIQLLGGPPEQTVPQSAHQFLHTLANCIATGVLARFWRTLKAPSSSKWIHNYHYHLQPVQVWTSLRDDGRTTWSPSNGQHEEARFSTAKTKAGLHDDHERSSALCGSGPTAVKHAWVVSFCLLYWRDDNFIIYHRHYVIRGPEGSPYQNGIYHGKLRFPPGTL